MATAKAHPPIVDLSLEKSDIIEKLFEAATTSGFFYVTGHSIPQELIDRAFEVNKRYFDMSAEEKAKLPQVVWSDQKLLGHEIGNRTAEGLVREGHFKWWPVHEESEAAYPAEELVPGFKDTIKEFMAAMPAVYNKILSCYAIGLGFPEDFFEKIADPEDPDNYSVFVTNKYPAVDGIDYKPGTARITAHTDETLVTLLFTSPGSAGLELAAGKDGKAVDSAEGHFKVESWKPCPNIPGCITVNIGDSLQAYSDGLLKSNYHRVRMPEPGEPTGERYSMGYFVWPKNSSVIQGPKKAHAPITFSRFMEVKSKGFGYVLSPHEKVYEDAQAAKIALGMPEVQPITAAA